MLSAKYEVKSAKVSDIAIGNGNLAVLYKSGKVKVYGNDEDRQCETQNWHLRPARISGLLQALQ